MKIGRLKHEWTFVLAFTPPKYSKKNNQKKTADKNSNPKINKQNQNPKQQVPQRQMRVDDAWRGHADKAFRINKLQHKMFLGP